MGCGSSVSRASNDDRPTQPPTLPPSPAAADKPHGVSEAATASQDNSDVQRVVVGPRTPRVDANLKPHPAVLEKLGSLREGSTPHDVLKSLMDGNTRFTSNQSAHPHQDFRRLQALRGGQKPQAAILGCADSRVPAEIVFDQGFGDVFVCRVAGNIATPEEVASLEYAVLELGVKVVLVLGHTGCGAVKAAMTGKAFPGFIDTLVDNIDVAVARVKSHSATPRASTDHGANSSTPRYGGDDAPLDVKDADMVTRVVEENVRYQLTRCKRSVLLLEAMKTGQLLLVGAVYELDTGMVKVLQVLDRADA